MKALSTEQFLLLAYISLVKAAYLYVGTLEMKCRPEKVIVGIGEDIFFLSPSYKKITSKTPEIYITTLALMLFRAQNNKLSSTL